MNLSSLKGHAVGMIIAGWTEGHSFVIIKENPNGTFDAVHIIHGHCRTWIEEVVSEASFDEVVSGIIPLQIYQRDHATSWAVFREKYPDIAKNMK